MSMVTVHGPHTMYDNEEHGALAGTPGSFLGGAGVEDPADLTELRAEVKPAGSLEAWYNGQYVVLGDASHAYWDGNSWEVGEAPNATVSAGTPGTFSPAMYTPDNVTELAAQVTNPVSRFVDGEYVVVSDGQSYYWDGDSWELGVAPAGTITDVVPGLPGYFTPDPYYSDLLYANITALRADTYVGTTGSAVVGDPAWTGGEHVVLANAAQVYWTGSAWATGVAP
jgi:hypothetical protein